jgi:tRNA (guanine37-N1)-methyltransferase
MKCEVLTLFPDIINTYLSESILKRAQDKKLLEVKTYNIRNFASDKHNTVDDYPYGGGPGMVLKPEPLYEAIDFLKKDNEQRRIVLLSPQGKPFNQMIAEEFAREKRRVTFICGRYEGIDERVRIALINDEISIGDYVMTGGELAALVIIDTTTRLIPGAIGDEKSIEDESFSWGLLDYPHYTRPREYRGLKVPDILVSGNHKEILRWRRKEAIKKTLNVRPDLIKKSALNEEDEKIILEIESSSEDG